MNEHQPDTNTRAATIKKDDRLWKWGAGAAAVGALAGAGIYNARKARKATEANPPVGEFIDVSGVALHYLERGEGSPIVLLHGNGAMIEDWLTSGLFDRLAARHRVIAFDRPGFGHSERPRSTIWTAEAQAALIAEALAELGVEQPLLVGHSWGTQVALALALNHPELPRGLVLMGGYYYPTLRADALFSAPAALPVVGDAMRYTVSPLLAAAISPLAVKKVFSPAPVPDSFSAFPLEMTFRPSQIRAEAAEAGMMIPGAVALGKRYDELDLPVTIIAGSGDKMVFPGPQSERLHEALPGSRLHLVEGAGHMVHHSATAEVAGFIEEAATQNR
jgi:pimeloyl-ACP methyl ester carboxylesterase